MWMILHGFWSPGCRDLTQAPYARLAPPLPVPRGPVRLSPRQVLPALWSVAAPGGTGRGLPARFGPWPPPLSTRLPRWVANRGARPGLRDLHREPSGRLTRAARSLDRPLVQVPPAGPGARTQPVLNPWAAPEAAGPPRCLGVPRTIARRSPARARPGPPPPPRRAANCGLAGARPPLLPRC